MNSVNNMVNNISKGFQNGFELIAFTVNHSEPLEKVAKITERSIRIAGVILGNVSRATSNLESQLRDAITVFETVRFVGIVNVLITPNNGKYFLTDEKNSWQKRADRVTLAFHCAFKTVKGLNKFGFVELGIMAKNAIGKLPIFTLVMDSFVLASSFFSSWESIGNNLPKARKKVAEADEKIVKWECRRTAIAYLKIDDEIERKHFEARYQKKSLELHAELDALKKKFVANEDKLHKAVESQKQSGQEIQVPAIDYNKIVEKYSLEGKKLTGEIERTNAKLKVTDERVAKIAAGNCKGLAEDLEKTNIDLKMKKWEVCKANAQQEETKIWVKIANAIGKIAVVALALTLTAINLWTVPFTLSLLFMGILVDSIGLSKIYIEEFWKPKPIPKNTEAVFI